MAMKTVAGKNENFDLVVAELFKASALRDDEVEAIVSDVNLFSSIRTRIIADSVARKGSVSSFTFIQRTAILSAAAAIIVVAVFGAMMFAKRPVTRNIAGSLPQQQHKERPVSQIVESQPDIPPVNIDGPAAPSRMPNIDRAMDYRPVTTEHRTSPKQQPQFAEKPPEFYALAGLRSSEETVNGSRIIRVELPRASLVALGVNVPLDSDKQVIKTDLLIGPDGVPRAIRLVE